MADYNANIFSIEPNSKRVVFENDNGGLPGCYPNDYIWNIGRTTVYAETLYGTKSGWIGDVSSATIKPGESKELSNLGKSYSVLGLRIHNRTNVRAIVHAAKAPYGNFPQIGNHKGSIDVNYHNLMKELVVFGSKFILTVGSSLSGVVNTFWPEDQPTPWQQVQEKVNKLIDERIQKIISGLLDGEIRCYKERIKGLITQIEKRNENVASNYMNIAQDLVGLENKFSFGKDQPDSQRINYSLLPLYSTLVTLKLGFYSRGLAQAAEIGLSTSDVDDIRRYAHLLIHDHNGAVNYIIDLFRERLQNAYNTAYQEDIYDMMMNTRSYCAVHGLEYIPMWKAMLEDPTSDGKVYNDVISYSQFYGSQSPDLYKQAIPEYVPKPLTPKYIDDDESQRNKLTKVIVYKMLDTPKIKGLRITFENRNTFMMGESSVNDMEIDFNGAYLTKLVAKGSGAVDQLVFTFSDGREVPVGLDSNKWTAFELENHHIASIYLSSGSSSLAGQAANIAVSYQRNDTLF